MKPLIVANWKMNPSTLIEATQLFNSVKKGLKNIKNIEIVICPPFVYFPRLQIRDDKLKLGAQDCFWENPPAGGGAFTGEISPIMLKNLGCKYVIIGHSERRKLGETDEMINKKIKAALETKLKPILCIGETEKERAQGKTFKVLKSQLEKAFYRLTTQSSLLNHLVVAYEPVWAIGSGNPCGISEAKAVNLFIRKIVKNLPILYGGSVNSQNAESYIKEAKFQGFMVGGASLNPQEFIRIVKSVSKR